IGVLQYARPTKDWAFIHCTQDNVLEDLARTDGFFSGGIGEFGRPDLWAAAKMAVFPVINLYGGHGFRGLPTVGIDDREIGRMAARHLMEQGHKNFAFFGLKARGYSHGRWAGYFSELGKHGYRPDCYKSYKNYPAPNVAPVIYVGEELSFAGWIKTLPKPCGIFCCDDIRAEWVTVECQNLGLRVPDDISVLGVDDDEVHCISAVPHLSSVRLPVRQAGYEAAKMLDRIMESRSSGKCPRVLFPPERVVCRESTDLLAVGNPQLVRALKFIRANAHTGKLSVRDVVAQTSYCRRILESKFREAFGRTIFHEIRRLQVEQSKKLLRETVETMESIAEATGWGSASHFGVEFKKITGQSPGEYRKRMR
ncbi:MAG: substrate-binding domain-containing protein, partial [Verrucomicrobiota bacterium]